MKDISGATIDKYHIVEPLGTGGMASVYKAHDMVLERYVAIKFIRSDAVSNEMFLKRFEREAKALARLSHPNIVKIYDYGEHQGAPYVVMEYISGGTYKQFTGKSILWKEAVKLVVPLCSPLAYIHKNGIIHRDIKPSNLLVSDSGQPMLTDFGIAKILETTDQGTLTGTGVGIGTPEYMSPEQGLGRQVDQRSDIYSMGVVLYELITGKRPYSADTPMAIIFKHNSDPLPSPRQFIPDLPVEVEQILFKALAKNPDYRYQSIAEFSAALEALIQRPAIPYETALQQHTGTHGPPIEIQDQSISYHQQSYHQQSPQSQPRAITPKKKKKSFNIWFAILGAGGAFICFLAAALILFGPAILDSIQPSSPINPDLTSTHLVLLSTWDEYYSNNTQTAQARELYHTEVYDYITQTIIAGEQALTAIVDDRTPTPENEVNQSISETIEMSDLLAQFQNGMELHHFFHYQGNIDTDSTIMAFDTLTYADIFQFYGNEGQRMKMEILAQRNNSPMDPVIRIFLNDEMIDEYDDSEWGYDPIVEFEFPEDGMYYFMVADLNNGYSTSGEYFYEISFFDYSEYDSFEGEFILLFNQMEDQYVDYPNGEFLITYGYAGAELYLALDFFYQPESDETIEISIVPVSTFDSIDQESHSSEFEIYYQFPEDDYYFIIVELKSGNYYDPIPFSVLYCEMY